MCDIIMSPFSPFTAILKGLRHTQIFWACHNRMTLMTNEARRVIVQFSTLAKSQQHIHVHTHTHYIYVHACPSYDQRSPFHIVCVVCYARMEEKPDRFKVESVK